jgi:peptidyl-prolyl cis-trans isomerase SurA
MMTLRTDRFLPIAASACALSLLLSAPHLFAQAAPASAPSSPYGGQIVEQAVARVNDQIISTSDYERAMKELDNEARQRGATMQQIAEGHKDLLRNLIDQQLWLSKGKELDINVDTEVIKELDDIRKKYKLESMEDLEKAAQEQHVSYEDFKANIKNQLMTQEVMRKEVGYKVQFTPGEAQRYYETHKQDYKQPESVHLSEIMVSAPGEDAQSVATAKAKADDIVAKLRAGANFDALARSSSDGPTAAQGGDMGKFNRGGLAKVFEDATFDKPAGSITDPIRTKQGYVIFKVDEHVTGGVQPYKDVQAQVEEAFYQERMGPAIRDYLNKMREEAYIVIRPGYSDSAATPNELKPTISYSAYTPPSPKKKKKAQRTRFRETERSFRNKGGAKPVETSLDTTPATAAQNSNTKNAKATSKKAASAAAPTTMKAGKKEKIRFGQAPRETLPETSKETQKEDAGALPETAKNEDADIANPLDQKAAPEKKTRYSERAKLPKAAKPKGPQLDSFTPTPADSQEVADRQTQSAPLGMTGDTKKKKKQQTTTGEKTRMQQRPKDTTEQAPLVATPAAPVQGAPAPKAAPSNMTAPTPSSAPQQTPASPDPPQSDTPPGTPPH